MRRLAMLFGNLWTTPNTVLGILGGLSAMPYGARPYRIGCALAFRCMPRFTGALTLGSVILHDGPSLDAKVRTYNARRRHANVRSRVSLIDHERAHVLQYLVFGPLFLPVYFLCGGVSARNPFERAADRYALTGRGWWPFTVHMRPFGKRRRG